jgi:uncharacterized protein (DUF433 family)
METKEGSQMEWKECIVIDPKILAAKPVVKRTRLAVEFIVDLLAQRWSEKEITRTNSLNITWTNSFV